MEILVCVKRVPDTSENEIEVNSSGTDVDRDDLVYSVNEWDNYAVEEAIQIVDKTGGAVTVVSMGDEESEEVVRREMAMGANNGILVSDDAFKGSDGKAVATILKAVVGLVGQAMTSTFWNAGRKSFLIRVRTLRARP